MTLNDPQPLPFDEDSSAEVHVSESPEPPVPDAVIAEVSTSEQLAADPEQAADPGQLAADPEPATGATALDADGDDSDASAPESADVDQVEAELDRAIADLGPAPSAFADDDIIAAVDDGRSAAAPSWPFAVYVGAWLVFAALVVWRFIDVPADTALYDVPLYRWIVTAGVTLTVLGPVLALVVWAASLRRPGAQRGALFASAFFKGAISTFAGVCIWWASLLILDQIRIGSLL